jgi:hypothetical protein
MRGRLPRPVYDPAVPLRLVPQAPPDPKQATIERIKQRPKREPGTIQCKRCGGRDIMTVVSGSWIDQHGQYHKGTVTSDKVCFHCDRKGIVSFMMPSPPKPAT